MDLGDFADEMASNDYLPSFNKSSVLIHIDNLRTLNQNSSGLHTISRQYNSTRNGSLQSSVPLVQQDESWVQKVITRCQQNVTKRGLKQKLEKFYQLVTIPCVSWLDDGRDMLIKDYYIELQLDANEHIPINKIFDKVDGVKPTRILIEGQPGYGKTTLTAKIAYDWATREKYLRDFHLLFVIPLGTLQGESIYSAIKSIARHCGFNNGQKMMKMIDDNQEKTLLILDGLDELASSERESVLKIIYRQIYNDVTVVITCRTGLFKLEQEEKVNLFGEICVKKAFYDKRIVIVGVNHQDRKEFLSKFMSNAKATSVMQHLEKLTQPISEIFKSPLLIILLAFILQKKPQFALTNKTNLYKNLFNCIIRRSLDKRKVKVRHIDLFNFEDVAYLECQELIHEFGIRVLDHIKNNKCFEDDELNNTIYQLGFLVNHKDITHFESSKRFEGYHLSILEFAAAFSLWREYQKSNKKFSSESIMSINEIFLQLGETSLVLPFLIGLLEDNAKDLFKQLKEYSCFYSTKPVGFWNMMQECQTSTVIKDVVRFIPCEISTSGNFSIDCKDVVENGIAGHRILHVPITDKNSIKLVPSKVYIPLLTLALPLVSNSLEDEDFKYLETISCKTFALTFKSQLGEQDVLKYFSLFTSINAKKRILVLEEQSIAKILLKCVQEGDIFHKTKLQFLHVNICKDQSGLKLLQILLSKNVIKKLRVKLTDAFPEAVETIVEFASNSEFLDSLTLMSRQCVDLDFHQLTLGGQKCWKDVRISGARLICSKQISNKNCVSNLTIHKTPEVDRDSVSIFQMVNPLSLKCNSTILHGVQQRLETSWSGYQSVRELIVLLDKTSLYTQFWRDLKFFNRLETLEIVVPTEFFHLFSEESMISLQSLKINKLVVSWSLFQIISVHEQFKGGIKLRLTNVFPKSLKEVDFFLHSYLATDAELVKEFTSVFSEMLVFFERSHFGLRTINIVSYHSRLLQCVLQTNVIDFSVFSVKHFVRKQSDTDYTYTELSVSYVHVLSINLK